MKFAKLQATGNDFILIEDGKDRDWSSLAEAMCHRHSGIGADGLIVLLQSKVAQLRMRLFNPDGSEAEACGNGLRCLTDTLLIREYSPPGSLPWKRWEVSER
jgi:diaminopimelate epimerase